MTKNAFELVDLVKHFQLCNKTEGKSPQTLRWYETSLTQFSRFLKESGKPTNLAALGEVEAREFILFLQNKKRWQDNPFVTRQKGKLAAISIQTYIRGLRAFFNWLYKEGYTNENRLARLKPPKAPNKIVEIISPLEIRKILKCIDTGNTAGARNYAIMLE